LEYWEPSQHLLLDIKKPRKTCAEVAGRSNPATRAVFWPTFIQEKFILMFQNPITKLFNKPMCTQTVHVAAYKVTFLPE
jgi:hypothetical protein